MTDMRLDDLPVENSGKQRAALQTLVIAFAALLVSLYQSVLIPILGVLPQELDTSTSTVQWLLTSTFLVGALSMPIFGRLGDMFGKRLMLQVAMASGVAGSLICALSSDVAWLIVGRSFQGAAMAAIPLAISLLATLLPPEKRAGSIALVGAMLGIGGALGMPLSGFVADRTDFHMLFWITFVAGVAALIALSLIVPESPMRSGGRFDLVGAVLLSAALIALLLPLAQASTWGWSDRWTLGLLAASALLFWVFGAVQLRHDEPLVDLAAARNKPVLMAHVASTLFGIAAFASYVGTTVFVTLPEATGYGFGTTVLVGGLMMLPGGLSMLPASALAGRLINTVGATQTMCVGAALMGSGWLARIWFSNELWQIALGTVIVSCGISIGTAALPNLINHYTPAAEIAAANGLNTLTRNVGGSLASALGGTLMGSMVMSVGGYEFPTLGAFQLIFAACAVAAGLALLLGLLMPKVPAQGKK